MKNEEKENLDGYHGIDFRSKYHELHKFCPKCGSDRFEVTFMGYPLIRGKENLYKDLNHTRCSGCGYQCTVHDRVANFPETDNEPPR